MADEELYEDAYVQQCILDVLRARGPNKTVCPSECARRLHGERWRELMPLVRKHGVTLAAQGKIVVLQKGQIVDPGTARGAIRYRIAS